MIIEQKTVKKSRRKYDAELKKDVVKMVESSRSVPEVARSLGIGTNLIYYWTQQAKKKAKNVSGLTDDWFDEEKAALQKRIKELEMERDVLKKALGIFSRPI